MSSDKAQNLTITNAIRAQLVAAAAAPNGIPTSEYVGLTPGLTYYAFDPVTSTYWAGAQLDPSPASLRAQVSVQDDGAYDVFHRSASGSWIVDPVGASGPDPTCATAVPAAVVAVWGWAPGTCRPPSA